jgi:hypothetical protein
MKMNIFLLLCFMELFGSFSLADLDHTISDTYYDGILTLNSKSLQVMGTGVKEIVAYGTSYIEVQNTLPLQTGVGGIESVKLYNNSSMTLSGGEVSGIDLKNSATLSVLDGKVLGTIYATGDNIINIAGGATDKIYANGSTKVTLSGGNIGTMQIGLNISSTSPPTYIVMCDLYSLNRTYINGVLSGITGNWLDGSGFDIEVGSRIGNPTSDYIQFVPEPATLTLLGVGGLMLRKRKR